MPERAAVAAGGAVGAVARVALAQAWTAGTFPWATLVANVAGCLVLGAVLVLTAARSPRRALLGPGLCGGLTTFSAFQLELVELLRDGDVATAALYAAASMALGLLALRLGELSAGPAGRGGAQDRPSGGAAC